MEKDIRNRVKMVTAKAEEMNEQTGIFPSLREEDINEYTTSHRRNKKD